VTRPRNVRTRLALWHGAALVAVVAVYAAAVFAQVRDDLYESLDGQLAGDHALAVQWLRQDGATADAPVRGPSGPSERQTEVPWIDAWTADGRRVFDAGRRPPLPSPAGPPSTWVHGPRSMRFDSGRRTRVEVVAVELDGTTVYVRVGRSEEFTRQELGEFAAALALSLPAAFTVAAFAAYLLARRALTPVAAMTTRARQITADRLDQRLPIVDPADEFGQLAGVINDLLSRLDQAFQTLRRFTADASHELRTPLTAIRSVGEVGLRGRRSEPEYREIIGSILEEVDRLTQMTDSLLLLSRADSGKADLRPAELDLAALAREVAGDLDVLAEERRLTLRIDAPADPVLVTADRSTLRQAVANLLDNAIKYSPEGAEVHLAVRCTRAEAVLAVADAGPGIAAEHLPHIFDRFYRADAGRARDQRGGAGLGLAIARWAVEANGGRIEVESTPERGSVFRVVLAAADVDPASNQGRKSCGSRGRPES
jgi:heavy metal sensor kinase